ncbi:hypothetical protein L6164_035425 [Bauhinia variegata]|uniref:Uncharacterized protein n=1 Tax=Bauhinia variegata TaxID=167791 RepID=A0ACB9KDX2_BAUVA|nr:hypothetical protein L6164_035425 [Bauhinia variegata]
MGSTQPSNGFARHIVFRNLVMKNVYNPIIINQRYCPGNGGCPRQLTYVKGAATSSCRYPGGSNSGVVIPRSCL